MRALNFLHRQLHKVFPPRIPSPYLYGAYGRALKKILVQHASKARVAVEFGILHGHTTKIIANALPFGAQLYSYDIHDLPELALTNRTDIFMHMEKRSIFNWEPFPFDFMWIDVAATPDQMWVLYHKLWPYLRDSVVLSEGTHRKGDKVIYDIPSRDLCTIPPGIFQLIP